MPRGLRLRSLLCIVAAGMAVGAAPREIVRTQGRAPALRPDLRWVNVRPSLGKDPYAGRLTIVYFWRCGHALSRSRLARIEEVSRRFHDKLLVVGVHAPKFPAERDLDAVRQALRTEGVTFPVLQDPALDTWRDFQATAWGTLLLVDPLGNVIVRGSGPGVLDAVIGFLEDEAEARYGRVLRHRSWGPPPPREKETPLSCPSGILFLPRSDRLVIADTGHHRIVVADGAGRIEDVIGGPGAGLRDGTFDEARFRSPVGLAVWGGAVLVADRGNDCVRKVDLEGRRVTRVWCGGRADRRRTMCSLPTDLTVLGDRLFVACAGTGRVAVFDLGQDPVSKVGEVPYPGRATGEGWRQPQGLIGGPGRVYIADGERSSLVVVDPADPYTGRCIVEGGIFDFGDRDGPAWTARLQYPGGLTDCAARLVLADTFNHKIKVLDPGKETLRTLAGTGEAGHRDGSLESARFSRPADVACGAGRIYVADSGNDAVRVMDLAHDVAWTLSLQPHPDAEPASAEHRTESVPKP